MNIKFTTLQLAAVAIIGIAAQDTASGLDPTMVPTLSPSPSVSTPSMTTNIPTIQTSDMPSDMASDTMSDMPSDMQSDVASDLPSMSDTTGTSRRNEETSGAASCTSLLGVLLLAVGLF